MMPKDLYDKNLAQIKAKYGSDKVAGQAALDKLNDAARRWQPAPTEPVDPRIRTDPRLTGVLGSPEKQKELLAKSDAEKAAFNNMSTQEQIANQVGKMLGVSSNIAMLASVPTFLAGGVGAFGVGGKQFMTNLANNGLGNAIKNSLIGSAKTIGRVGVPITAAAKTAGEVQELAEENGVGPQTAQLLGNVGGAVVGAVSNPLVNKVLPIGPHVTTGKLPNRTGPKWAQKVVDFFGENTHPGGREAYNHPRGGQIIADAKTFRANRAQDIKAPAEVSRKEMEAVIKKMGPESRKPVEAAVTAFYKDPSSANRAKLPKELANSPTFLNGLAETNRRFNDFTDANEINYRNIFNVVKEEPAFPALYKQRNNINPESKVKKQDLLNYVADLAEGKITPTPEEAVVMRYSPITAHMQRSARAKNNVIAALREPRKAQAGSVEFNEVVDHYLPRRYSSRIEGLGFVPDQDLVDNAIAEQIANGRKPEVAARRVANLVGSGAPGAKGGATPTTVTHVQKLKLDEQRDAELMKAMGRIEDPFYLLDDAIDNVTSSAAKRRQINQLIEAELLTNKPQNITDKRVTISTSNEEPFIMGDPADSINGGSYFTPNTFARAITPKDRDKLATFRNLTDANREASVINNFASQARNAAGDQLVKYLAGGSVTKEPANLKWAAQTIRKFNAGQADQTDELAQILREGGVLGTGFVQATRLPSGLSRAAYTRKKTGNIFETGSAKIADVVRNAPGSKTMEKIANTEQIRRLAFARDAYQRLGGTNGGFNLNTMEGINNRATAQAAINETNRVLLNYRDKSVLTNTTNAFAPVSSWTIGSALNHPGVLLENPGRAIAAAYTMKATNDLLDPLGVRVNFNQTLPLGDIAQAGQDIMMGADAIPALMRNLKGSISPGLNPYVSAAEALYGRTLNGFDVYNETDSPLTKLRKGGEHLAQSYIPANYRQFMGYPNANPNPNDLIGGPAMQTLAGLMGQRDRVTGEVRMTPGMGAARMLGVPVLKDTQGTVAKQILNTQRDMQTIKTALKKKAQTVYAQTGKQLDNNDPLVIQLYEKARIIDRLTQEYMRKGGGTNGRQN